jgi:4-hydroxyproline epimerase
MKQIQVIDSHTGGEPTRIVIAGGPDLGQGSLAERQRRLQSEFDEFRSVVVNEPRGSSVLVGGLICEPEDKTCAAGVIFFNNYGYLGMCGHGSMGLMVTLRHLGRIETGSYRLETSVGIVGAELRRDGQVSIENVPSFRYRRDVEVNVPEYGTVTGDIGWGGNWFFLVKNIDEDLVLENVHCLSQLTMRIRDALQDNGITGADEAWIDHVELFGSPRDSANDSRNFVLCPGGAYDRSPCGTGTSAKLACLAADEKLAPGQLWKQESIVGSVFSAHYQTGERDQIIPTITGSAYICGVATLMLDPADPFCMGIGS